MEDWQILGITAAVIIGIVVMILRLRINPALSLVIGAMVLGLLTGLGTVETTKTVMTGFGEIMTKVGLLIAWGVLMGAILNEMGAISKLVDKLLHVFGPKGVPYALGLTIGTALQSIFLDVLLVMSAPLAKRIAPKLGKFGTAKMATAMAISLECGIVLMVPGVAAVALAGLLQVPLGEMLIFGLLVIIPTILVSIFIMNFFIQRGLWKPETDEEQAVAESPELEDADGMVVHTHEHGHERERGGSYGKSTGHGVVRGGGTERTATSSRVGLLPHDVREPGAGASKEPGLLLMFAPDAPVPGADRLRRVHENGGLHPGRGGLPLDAGSCPAHRPAGHQHRCPDDHRH